MTSHPAVTVAGESLEREEVFAAAAVVADRVAGAPAVAVHGSPTLRTAVATVGCLLAGVPLVPVPADAGAGERAHLVRDSGATLWLGDAAEGVTLPVVPVDPTERSSMSHTEATPDATAMIMYTSGTTGAPKGVVISHGAIAACLDGLRDAWAWSPDDVLVHGLPLFHVHGLVLGLLGALRHGSALIHTGRPSPSAYAAAAAAGGTLFFGVPTVWSRLAAEPAAAAALRGARLLVSGSASLPAPVAALLAQQTGAAPLERYGMTETLITVAARHDAPRRTGWVGQPIDGVRTRLRGEQGEAVAHDGQTIGELQVRGSTMFEGYLGLGDVTAAAHTDDGWFRTGDAAVIDDDGAHRIVGRLSVDLIKTGGYRVGAGEVEASLLGHPAVREAAVVGIDDPDLGQRIVAYLVGDRVDDEALADHVAADLSAHKRPREIRWVGELPRNELGKVQKRRLTHPDA